MIDVLHKLRRFFVSLKLTVTLLALGLVLIFWATLAQVELGVWGVQERFFYRFFIAERIPGTGIWVPFPGGYGTMDEGFEALTLMQTGKSQIMPLVLVDKPGGTYWKTWDKNIREHLLRNGLISPDDLYLYQITDDVAQAVRWITRFYRNYDSMRFVKERLVLRLKNAPSASALAALNEDFADITLYHFGPQNGYHFTVSVLGWSEHRAKEFLSRQFCNSLRDAAAG